MKQAALRLYDNGSAQLNFDDLAAQLERMPEEMRVWLDAQFARGARFDALDDAEVERDRLGAVPPGQLRSDTIIRSRGIRRAWFKPPSAGARGHYYLSGEEGGGWCFVAYEPALERELGSGYAKSDHERAKLTHWKRPGAEQRPT